MGTTFVVIMVIWHVRMGGTEILVPCGQVHSMAKESMIMMIRKRPLRDWGSRVQIELPAYLRLFLLLVRFILGMFAILKHFLCFRFILSK